MQQQLINVIIMKIPFMSVWSYIEVLRYEKLQEKAGSTLTLL